MTDRTTLINERKETSVAYQRWQEALELRKRIVLEVGSDNEAHRRATRLIQTWHARWEDEMNSIDAVPSAELLADLLEAEDFNDLWSSKQGANQ